MRHTKPFIVEVRRKRGGKKPDTGSLSCAPDPTAEANRGKGEHEGALKEPMPEGGSGDRVERPSRD